MNIGVSKKTEKPIKPRKPEKKTTEKTEPKKKPIKILKNRLVRFGFISKKPKNRTEPKPKKPSQTGKTEPKPRKPSQTGFGSVSVFF
jgi:hypothetical protein